MSGTTSTLTLVSTLCMVIWGLLASLFSSVLLPGLASAPYWNFPIINVLSWTAVVGLIYFVNAVVWLNSYADLSSIWSLISAHIIKGYTMAVAAGVFVTVRRLYYPSRVFKENISNRKLKLAWEIVFDGLLCNGPPILQVFLNVFIQPRKYDILEGFGPWLPSADLNIRIPIEIVPLFIFFALTMVFAVLCIINRSTHDTVPDQYVVLKDKVSANLNRYNRMLACCILVGWFCMIINAVNLMMMMMSGMTAYTSLADVRSDYGVGLFSTDEIAASYDPSIFVERWLPPVTSVAFFFALFGEAPLWRPWIRAGRRFKAACQLDGLRTPSVKWGGFDLTWWRAESISDLDKVDEPADARPLPLFASPIRMRTMRRTRLNNSRSPSPCPDPPIMPAVPGYVRLRRETRRISVPASVRSDGHHLSIPVTIRAGRDAHMSMRSNTDGALLFVPEDLGLSPLPSPVSLVTPSVFSLAQPPRPTACRPLQIHKRAGEGFGVFTHSNDSYVVEFGVKKCVSLSTLSHQASSSSLGKASSSKTLVNIASSPTLAPSPSSTLVASTSREHVPSSSNGRKVPRALRRTYRVLRGAAVPDPSSSTLVCDDDNEFVEVPLETSSQPDIV
ncbi:hypothetical protein FISHEDRAFT_69052 [Fistulina hepatica ATCC 64428]|uniref:STE3-domain-containing protein n=1 Tax=Fistulina hepatica ATCC 64428 TaxID=1128425 RepID=A0A0D7APG9_9AGAR|nr:hypothetical protein FISHEDRAFT_69052 [Fistulina hepatica ATCC 64428]